MEGVRVNIEWVEVVKGGCMMIRSLAEQIEATGASKSLWRTIDDVERMMDGLPLGKAKGLRKRLRSKIRRAMYQVEEKYYRMGYRRGVFSAYGKYQKTGKLSGNIRRIITVPFRSGDPKFVQRRKLTLEAGTDEADK